MKNTFVAPNFILKSIKKNFEKLEKSRGKLKFSKWKQKKTKNHNIAKSHFMNHQ